MQLIDILYRHGWLVPARLDDVPPPERTDPQLLITALLRLGWLDRNKALAALEEALGLPAVDLSQIEINPDALSLLPGPLAWQLRALPLAIDNNRNACRITCLDPQNQTVISALNEAARGRSIEICVSLKGQLESALLNFYRPSLNAITEPHKQTTADDNDVTEPSSRLLLIGPLNRPNQQLGQALAEEFDRVVLVETVEEALAELEEHLFAALLINDSSPGTYLPLMRRFRAASPSGQVRFYRDARHLIFGLDQYDPSARPEPDIARTLIEVSVDKATPAPGHDCTLAAMTDRLCFRLGLPDHQRLRAVLAARLCTADQSGRSDLPGRDPESNLLGDLSTLSRELDLDTITGLAAHEAVRLQTNPDSFDRLAADAIALISFCLNRWSRFDHLDPERYQTIRTQLTTVAGRRFLPDVVAAWTDVLRDRLAISGEERRNSQVVLLNDRGEDTLMLQPCLENLDFRVTTARTVEQVLPAFQHRRPDIMLILKHGPAGEVRNLVEDIAARGIPIEQLPTFVLAERPAIPELTALLKAGVEDIISLDGDLDPLLVKMCRVRSRLEQESNRRLSLMQDVGTHGTLEDMNVVDLLQAMGMSDKTVRLSITAHGSHLCMFLDHGQLTYAECEDRTGAEAVFAGLAWTKGVWSVDPVSREELPAPNNDRSIDSILIEGCCRIDERRHDGNAAESESASSVSMTADE